MRGLCQRELAGRRVSPSEWASASEVSTWITVRHGRFAARRAALRSGPQGGGEGYPAGAWGGRDQTAPNQLRQTRASIERAARPVRGADSSATTRSRSVTSTVSPLAANRPA